MQIYGRTLSRDSSITYGGKAGRRPTGDKVFCSDMTFDATVNPVVYEDGVPVFIDTEYDTWNKEFMALEKAFEIYPNVKTVVIAHHYGTPGKIDELKEICDRYGAVIIEDAAEFLGAVYKGRRTGTFGKYNCITFNGNKIITGFSGKMLLTDEKEAVDKVRKCSSQSRENAVAAMVPEKFQKEMVVTFIEDKDSKTVLHFAKDTVIKNDLNTDWVKEQIENTGGEPRFFKTWLNIQIKEGQVKNEDTIFTTRYYRG